MKRHEAIVIGAGLNGLTAAAYLARAGLSVLVLDRHAAPGGGDVGHEISPGFRLSRFSQGSAALPAQIVSDLDLPRFGLRFLHAEGGITLAPDGRYLASYRDGAVQRREIARHDKRDADSFTKYRRDRLADARRIAPLLTRGMDGFSGSSLRDFRARLSLLAGVAALDENALYEISRVWTQSMRALLDDHFTSDLLKAHLAGPALMGSTLGPSSPTSAMRLVAAFMGLTEAASLDALAGMPDRILPLGGPDALARALVASIEAHGGSIRMEAEVTDILMRHQNARGVVLANGEEIEANAILSDLDLKRSVLSLFQWKDLPAELIRQTGAFRTTGTVAKINLALDRMPDFPILPEGCPSIAGGLRLAASLDDMDLAYNDWRDRVPPRAPLIEVFMPSLTDPTLAPARKHVMSVRVQFVPATLHDGPWSDERKQALGQLVIGKLAEVSPGFSGLVMAQEILLARDIENDAGLTSGDMSQGDMTLDQMFSNRPFAASGGYTTPIRNFYLCSASAHPGSMMMGLAGANAATSLLTLRKKRGAA